MEPVTATIATGELIYEAYLLYRRAMAVLATIKAVDSTITTFSSLYDDDLRHHKAVSGEEMYLFILGRELVDPLTKSAAFTARDKDRLVMAALALSISRRHSHDVVTTVTDFLQAVGQTFQLAYPDFATRTEQYISSVSGPIVYDDPVSGYVTRYKGMLPASVITAFKEYLNFEGADVSRIWREVASHDYQEQWRQLTIKLVKRSPRFHRSMLIQSFLLRGARKVEPTPPISIDVSEGPDGLTLFLPTLAPTVVYSRQKFTPPDVRTITRAMVDQTQQREMLRRGYVLLDDRTWAFPDEIVSVLEYDPLTKTESMKLARKPKTMEFSPSEISSNVANKTIDKLKSTLIKKGEDKAVDLIVKTLLKT